MRYKIINRDMLDFESDTEVCNIGYNEGVLRDDRPYRIEMWSSYGINNATIFISTEDIEEASEKTIKKLLIENKIIDIIEDDILIAKVEDIDGNEFYSINVPIESNDHVINKCLVEMKSFYE